MMFGSGQGASTNPPAHRDTMCTVECGPVPPNERPAHAECRGWLWRQTGGPETRAVIRCGCWCHAQKVIMRARPILPPVDNPPPLFEDDEGLTWNKEEQRYVD